MAVTAALDEAEARPDARPSRGRADRHPTRRRGPTAVLLDWLSRLWPADLPAPTAVYRGGDAHLTDVPEPWVSINNLRRCGPSASGRARPLSMHRWRGNLWIEGLAPWEEFDLVGRTCASARRCSRCASASPAARPRWRTPRRAARRRHARCAPDLGPPGLRRLRRGRHRRRDDPPAIRWRSSGEACPSPWPPPTRRRSTRAARCSAARRSSSRASSPCRACRRPTGSRSASPADRTWASRASSTR
jgi:hypothetical protein